MKRLVAVSALILLGVSFSALLAADRAADEPGIRPDPRPTDLTVGRKGSNDEPKIRDEPRALDLSTPKKAAGRSTLEVSSLTPEQSEQVRAIRQRAAEEIQAIRDRERTEIMAVLNEQQRTEYMKLDNDLKPDRPRRVTTLPATTQALTPSPSGEGRGEGAWESLGSRMLTPPHPNLLPEGEGTRGGPCANQ